MPARPWDFTPDMYAAKLSRGRWKRYPHLVYIADKITAAILRGNGRVIVNLPPGYGKSDLVSFWVPMWYHDQFPAANIGLASYQSDIAIEFGRKIRNERETNPLCRVKLSEDSTAAGRFNTDAGGLVWCCGVDSSVLGKRFNLEVFDDPYKSMEEASKPEVRDKTLAWFFSTLYSRLEPRGSIVIVHQRFHPKDISGVLAKEGGWEIVSLPEIARDNDPLGRLPGESLCPDRFDGHDHKREIESQPGGEERYAAMYDQAPRGSRSGRLYNRFSDRNIDPTVRLDPSIPLHASFDFNINPGMHIEIGQHHENAGVFTAVHEIHAPNLDLVGSLSLLEEWIRRQGWKWPELHVFGDATGRSRNVMTTQSCYDMISNKLGAMKIPYRIRVPGKQPPIRSSVDALNDALLGMDDRVRYRVHPDCLRLIEDFEELQASPDGLIDKTNQKLSHASDCERYRVAFLKPAGGDQERRKVGRAVVGIGPAPAFR